MCADKENADTTPREERAVEFRLKAGARSRVCVAGSFNDWDTSTHPLVYDREAGAFSTMINLFPGTYEYKFLVDGVWCIDPDGPDWISNAFGSLNSLIHVK